ncbi:uncharacterized protein LOC124817256 [Hydra vulgaris]|uniref:uncharacterized protein LOC124817256 n=1 Tax=Hydra vulgaris TaxID=6087 RepID=UPI001F5FB687|nr:uncharacterized protein LOC124817256 [Hydra vulgaris]
MKLINGKKCKKRPQVAAYNALENLYDISTCRCNLDKVPCYDDRVKCKYLTCNNKHLVCVCPPECKIPLEEREYIKDQRSRNGTKGNIQLGPVDWSTVKKEKRRVGKCSNVKVPSCDNGESSFDINLESDTESSSDSEYNESIAISTYNLRKLDNFALECVRYAVSSEAAAALGNGLLKDLGVITKTDKTDVLDKSKIDRAKKRVCLQSVAEHNTIVQNLSCIGCDSKDDKGSLVYRSMLSDSISKKNKLIEKVYHLSFTVESGEIKGRYLTHKDILNATGENLAQSTFEVLKQYNSVDSLLGIVFDNTNVNTGYTTGLCASLERKLGRTIHKTGCALHSNELPLRHIIEQLDSGTNTPQTFFGEIGKGGAQDLHHKPIAKFEPVLTSLVFLENSVINDISSDHLFQLLLEYVCGISSGVVNSVYAHYKIGPVNHAR